MEDRTPRKQRNLLTRVQAVAARREYAYDQGMARGFNWGRSRMQVVIATRGVESAYRDFPVAAGSSKAAKKRKEVPHPKATQRRELLQRFEALGVLEREKRATEFRSRLRMLSTSDEDCDRCWKSAFAEILEHDRFRGRFRDAVDRAQASRRGRSGLTEEARRRLLKNVRKAPKTVALPKAQRREGGDTAKSRGPGPRPIPEPAPTAVQPARIFDFAVQNSGDGVFISWAPIENAARIRLDVLDTMGQRVSRMRIDGAATTVKIGKLKAFEQPLTVRLSATSPKGREIAVSATSIHLS